MRLGKVLRLASRDYRHEGQMAGFYILALAAVLGPLMVLFGLKFGIVGAMVNSLVEDPHNREIRPVGSGRYDSAWIAAVRARPEVGFLVPRTRSIAASIDLTSQANPRILQVELLPSAEGDPLLPAGLPAPSGLYRIVLSASAANRLGAKAGDTLDGSLARRFRGERERVHLDLKVIGVAPAAAFARDAAFVGVPLLEALEDYRDGRAVAALGWDGSAGEPRTYPAFRLYARSIYDVAGLKLGFERQGIEVRTRAADIELVQRMDRNLATIYWAIAIIGLVGFALSLSASLWANVDRKRKELSVLRLVGFRTGDIVWFPMVQALYTGLLGWALASLIYLGAAEAINQLLADQLAAGQTVCRLLPPHYAVALGLTLASALAAAGMAGWRASRVAPSDGLREL
jgi:putative ABC transport system permease protein